MLFTHPRKNCTVPGTVQPVEVEAMRPTHAHFDARSRLAAACYTWFVTYLIEGQDTRPSAISVAVVVVVAVAVWFRIVGVSGCS